MPPSVVDRLKERLDGWELVVVDAAVSSRGDGGSVSQEAIAAAHGAEVYIGAGVPREVLVAAGPALRWAHSTTAGISSFLYPEMVESAVAFTNSAGIHAAPMAETAIALMLHFARGLDFALQAQARGKWEPDPFIGAGSRVREIAGATLAIIGLGGIGREVQGRAVALGLEVVAIRSASTRADLEDALRRADYVLIAVPDTPRTRGLIGRAELALMKPTAVLVNLARGSSVDEDALADALRKGDLRGAGLDVFRTEPLPADSPLWRLPNVVILPHVSAVTTRFWEREIALILDNLGRYLAKQPLRNLVDKSRGY